MKITRIKHTKSAVAKKPVDKKTVVSGVLYEDPQTRGYAIVDIDEHLKDANSNAKRLFNIFNSIQKETEENKEYKKFISGKNGNKLLNSIFFNKTVKGEFDSFENVKKKISKTPEKELTIYNDVADLYTRKDLKSQKENIKKLYECLNNHSLISGYEKELEELYIAVEESYSKKRKLNLIKKSLKNQNMLVQPQDGVIKLSMPKEKSASKEGNISRNAVEKKALSSFIDMYADLDENNRISYLKKIACLIEIFFSDSENCEIDRNFILNEFKIKDVISVWKKEEAYLIETESYVEKQKNLENNRIKPLNLELKEEVRKKVSGLYRKAVAFDRRQPYLFEDDNINLFWLHHIENATERILQKLTVRNLYKLQLCYIKDKIRKDITNYISTKYIGIGKAVYQFGMNEMAGSENVLNFDNVKKRYSDGITSFDYEMIKAEETLQREVAVAVAFATNNLARATVDIKKAYDEKGVGKTDFLLWNDEVKKYLYEGRTIKNVLQYFGGYSSRKDLVEVIDENYTDPKDKEADFIKDLKEYIYALRNETMHFKTTKSEISDGNKIASKMFEMDVRFCTRREIEKFCSVGLNMFYEDDKIKGLLEKIYEKQTRRASQVPSFNTVLPRKQFANYLKEELNLKPDFKDVGEENNYDKWTSALYYTFKEIYYNGFLSDEKQARKLFLNALKNQFAKVEKNSVEYRAIKNFNERINEIKSFKENKKNSNNDKEEEKYVSLSEICQLIMTEYNFQNVSRKKKSRQNEKDNPDIYRHFKVILNKLLRESFSVYLEKTENVKFLIDKDRNFTEYISKDNIEPKDFLPDLELNTYGDLIKKVSGKTNLLKWYVVAKFLDGKTLNELLGSMRSYVQFVDDILRRSDDCGSKAANPDAFKIQIQQAIDVLDMCTKLCSVYSNDVSDYFEDYNDFLKNYIEESCVDDPVYHDEKNPIANRNIIEAKLFGPTEVLKNVLKDSKITRDDLNVYKNEKKNISVLMSKENVTKAEQQKIIIYQNRKNLVELRNLCDYGRLINDLFGQLINWSYLRERDLFYFQLGFHYTCLNNDTEKPAEGYKDIIVNGVKINRPILNQIASMYIYGLNAIEIKDNGEICLKGSSSPTGAKIVSFLNYSKKICEKPEHLYNAGLEVFEVIDEHDNIVKVRNAIDHFHYYYDHNNSILDYYAEVFDRFFTYDMKYKKNVINLLGNILLRYKVVLKWIEFGTGTKKVKGNENKERADFTISKDQLVSDKAEYKVKDGKETFDIKDEKFLDCVRLILEYSDKNRE